MRTSSMPYKKYVFLSLTSSEAVVQPLALEPMAFEPTATDTSNDYYLNFACFVIDLPYGIEGILMTVEDSCPFTDSMTGHRTI